MALGQSFAPLGNDPMQQARPGGAPGGPGGAQQAIKVLNLRMPRVAGAGAPAPQALLEGAGSAGLPQQQGMSPVIQAILQAVLGHFTPQQQSAPSAMGGMMPGPQGPGGSQSAPQMPTPAIHYQPLPGGTAGPNQPLPERRNQPTPPGKMNGFDYKA
jgi:hypothetical protein